MGNLCGNEPRPIRQDPLQARAPVSSNQQQRYVEPAPLVGFQQQPVSNEESDIESSLNL